MQTIFISLQTDNHTNASSLNVYRSDAFPDAQQCQSTEDKSRYIKTKLRVYYVVIRVTAVMGSEGHQHAILLSLMIWVKPQFQ